MVSLYNVSKKFEYGVIVKVKSGTKDDCGKLTLDHTLTYEITGSMLLGNGEVIYTLYNPNIKGYKILSNMGTEREGKELVVYERDIDCVVPKPLKNEPIVKTLELIDNKVKGCGMLEKDEVELLNYLSILELLIREKIKD